MVSVILNQITAHEDSGHDVVLWRMPMFPPKRLLDFCSPVARFIAVGSGARHSSFVGHPTMSTLLSRKCQYNQPTDSERRSWPYTSGLLGLSVGLQVFSTMGCL